MGSRHDRPLWFNEAFGGPPPRGRGPSNYVPEGTAATPCPKCGSMRQWMYIGKRRRPRVMCPACDELSGRVYEK